MSDLVGQTLDRYEIVELIGEGGMATVYRARQPRLERDVAVKVMLPALADDSAFRARFEREAKAIANLRHPNILTVYDYGETEDGQLYLVVDYVRGGTLREWLEAPPSGGEAGGGTERGALEILAQVAEALDYAHRQGVVHRDVKPNNILLTPDGHPLLADFGLVKPVESDRRLTASGVMLGTPDYVAPEQAQALDIDGRADIYALGVITFELLTGRHPFAGETPMSVIIKHITEPMPSPSQLNPSVSPALDEIVARATAKRPEERYERAGDLARALRMASLSSAALQPGAGPGAPLPTPPVATLLETPAPTSAARRWYQQTRVWVALVGVVISLVAVGLVLSLRSGQDQGDEAGVVPTARPGEVMILIAEFQAETGSERYNVSQRIYDKLSADLRELGEQDVSVYQVPEVIASSDAAIALGQKHGATTVIWGYYDDIGISPNVEAVGSMEESPMSVGLERLNLDADAVNFKLYIAKDLPAEVSFLTAISLLQVYSLQGSMERAILYTLMAADNLPEDPQFREGGETVLYIRALLAFFQGDAEGAMAYMDQAIAIAPDQASLYALRGGMYAQIGETERALADVDRAIALDPGDIMGYAMKSYAVWIIGDLEAALSAYERIIELEPDEWMGYWARSLIAFELGDMALALAGWERVEALDPDNAVLPVGRGLAYEKLGQTERAQADYARARTLGSAVDIVSQFLQVALIAQASVPAQYALLECTDHQIHGRIEDALASCNEALENRPTFADALWKRGQLYAAQGDWESAVADYTAAIEADPGWPWVYYLRAQALVELGRTAEAQADLTQALELDPGDELREQIESLDLER